MDKAAKLSWLMQSSVSEEQKSTPQDEEDYEEVICEQLAHVQLKETQSKEPTINCWNIEENVKRREQEIEKKGIFSRFLATMRGKMDYIVSDYKQMNEEEYKEEKAWKIFISSACKEDTRKQEQNMKIRRKKRNKKREELSEQLERIRLSQRFLDEEPERCLATVLAYAGHNSGFLEEEEHTTPTTDVAAENATQRSNVFSLLLDNIITTYDKEQDKRKAQVWNAPASTRGMQAAGFRSTARTCQGEHFNFAHIDLDIYSAPTQAQAQAHEYEPAQPEPTAQSQTEAIHMPYGDVYPHDSSYGFFKDSF